MSAPPAYDDTVGSSSGAPAYGSDKPSHGFPSAAEEKARMQQAMQASTRDEGEKRLKIWHAASGNSLITAADERTPIYNVIDSRAPDEAEQNQRSQQVQEQWQKRQHERGYGADSRAAGLSRQDPGSSATPNDVQFAQEIQQQRAHPTANGPQPIYSDLWLLRVRRGGDRNGPVIATIRRHVNTNSAVSIELEGIKTGIVQHSAIPHKKYEFEWQGQRFVWTKTHKAPGTSRFDGGNFVCRDERKEVYAYSTSEDNRCDGSLVFENRTVERGLLDIMMITGFVMRDLDEERNNPSYMRYGGAVGGGYGPYASPYANGYGFYPTPLFFPLLL